MGSLPQLVQCPQCSKKVRSNLLKIHLQKVHKAQNRSNDRPTKSPSRSSNALALEKFRRVYELINSWLKQYKSHLYSSKNVEVLTVMALEKVIGYSFDEINRIWDIEIKKDSYKVEVKRFKVIYEKMRDDLDGHLLRYRKLSIDQQSRDKYRAQDDDKPDDPVDWYDCNSVDKMDGSKYIGYHRREYEASRFGSFPVHDDYSEESYADDNPWE